MTLAHRMAHCYSAGTWTLSLRPPSDAFSHRPSVQEVGRKRGGEEELGERVLQRTADRWLIVGVPHSYARLASMTGRMSATATGPGPAPWCNRQKGLAYLIVQLPVYSNMQKEKETLGKRAGQDF